MVNKTTKPRMTRDGRKRLPPCPQIHVEAIAEFLEHHLALAERSLSDHRALVMTDKSDRLAGLIAWKRHQVATIRDLIASNAARRRHARATGSR